MGGSPFLHPPFAWESKEPIYPSPASTKKIHLLSESKVKEQSSQHEHIWCLALVPLEISYIWSRPGSYQNVAEMVSWKDYLVQGFPHIFELMD